MYPFKLATLEERKDFYQKEFSINKANQWLKKINFYPQFFAIDAGTESGIIKDKSKQKKLIIFKPNLSLEELKNKLIKYIPEDVYLDRNIYKDSKLAHKNMNFRKVFGTENCKQQILAFDIDSGNIRCDKCKNKGFLYFCLHCFKLIIKRTELAYYLLKKSFEKIECIYSGRGFHLYVLDKRATSFTVREREAVNKKLLKFAIDPWVSRGHIRLMRLPYSLNAIVSRVAVPISIKEIRYFDITIDKRTVPAFLLSKNH